MSFPTAGPKNLEIPRGSSARLYGLQRFVRVVRARRQDCVCARSTRLRLPERLDRILISTSRILGPAEERVVVARRVRIEAKAVLGDIRRPQSRVLEHPEIGKQGPALGMIGIEAEPCSNSATPFRIPLVCTQIAENDMRVSVSRIDLDGFLGGSLAEARCSSIGSRNTKHRNGGSSRARHVPRQTPGRSRWPSPKGAGRPCFRSDCVASARPRTNRSYA